MLTNKLAEFNLLVAEQSPDIIGVNEVLPKSYNKKIYPEEFQIDGYEMLQHHNIPQNKGRGSIIYIKKQLTNKEINIKLDKDFEEHIITEIPLSGPDKLICALIYRHIHSVPYLFYI